MANSIIEINGVQFSNSEVKEVLFGTNKELIINFDNSILNTTKVQDAIVINDGYIDVVFKENDITVFDKRINEYELRLNYIQSLGFERYLFSPNFEL